MTWSRRVGGADREVSKSLFPQSERSQVAKGRDQTGLVRSADRAVATFSSSVRSGEIGGNPAFEARMRSGEVNGEEPVA